MSMNPSFADWYRSAAVVLPEGRLEKRWEGIEALTEAINRDWVVYLAKLFVRADSEEAAHKEIRAVFHERDDTFPYKDNTEELRVLAGATLHHVIEQNGPHSLLAALALVCGSFGDRRRSQPTPEHLNTALRYLASTSAADRKASDQKIEDLTAITNERLAQLLPQQPFSNNQLPSTYSPILATFAEMATQHTQLLTALQSLAYRLKIREEELDFLWWLEAEFSRDLQRSFSDIGYTVGCLIFPSELADLTVRAPGPSSIIAILLRALRRANAPAASTTLTLLDAVNACPSEWRQNVQKKLNFSPYETLCPIHLAIAKSLTTDSPNEWQPVFRKVCNIPLQQSFPISEVAIQTYSERMLNAAWLESN